MNFKWRCLSFLRQGITKQSNLKNFYQKLPWFLGTLRPQHFQSSATCISNMSASENPLDAVEDVDIDGSGRFKYVLLEIQDKNKQFQKHIVRGHAWGGYHTDIYEDTEAKLLKLGISCKCLGGGRIEHWPDKKKISVYGYSQGYGRPDHSISAELLKKKYPDYTDISWSNDGY